MYVVGFLVLDVLTEGVKGSLNVSLWFLPAGLTFAGRAYDDSSLLRLAAAFEATGSRRQIPQRTPALSPTDSAQDA